MADYAARTQDGYLQKQATTYADAQTATPTVNNSGTVTVVGQHKATSTDFRIYRGGLSFDTSAIPAGSTIDSASLNYYITANNSGTDFSINLYYGTQPTFGGSLSAASWGAGTSAPTLVRSTAGVITNTKYTVSLPTDSINCGGITEYELRSNREGTAPTALEYVFIGAAEHETYAPYLTVTFTPPSDADSYDQDGSTVVLFIA